MVIYVIVVFFRGCGVLIMGEVGLGKFMFGFQLLQLGCDLVVDDCVNLIQFGDQIIVSSFEMIVGLIEGCGVGILKVLLIFGVSIVLVIDLD